MPSSWLAVPPPNNDNVVLAGSQATFPNAVISIAADPVVAAGISGSETAAAGPSINRIGGPDPDFARPIDAPPEPLDVSIVERRMGLTGKAVLGGVGGLTSRWAGSFQLTGSLLVAGSSHGEGSTRREGSTLFG